MSVDALDVGWRLTLLGERLALGHPEALLLLMPLLLLGVFALHRALRRDRRAAELLSKRLAGRVTTGLGRRTTLAALAARMLGLALGVLALAQPRCGTGTREVERRGVDVVVALDASRSMLAEDVTPNRLERAKLEVSALLGQLEGDRVGLIVFARDAFVQSPLTSDYAAARLFLRAVDASQMPQGGTDIGGALELAKRLLEGAQGPTQEKVVVLITDGEDLEGAALEGRNALRTLDARLFVVGVGTEEGAPIPNRDAQGRLAGYHQDARGQTVMTRLDRGSLERLVEGGGGAFFHRPGGIAVDDVAAAIARLEDSALQSRTAVNWGERFQPVLGLGLVLLLLAVTLEAWGGRR